MFWHLKQFADSFHETIMKRAIGEAGGGNYAPLGVFAWYVPAMIAADVTKGLMLGAGELPGYMKNYDLGDWMMHGVKRAGILGIGDIGDIGVEAAKDVTSLAGPTVEQATDFFFKPLEDNLIKALPANAPGMCWRSSPGIDRKPLSFWATCRRSARWKWNSNPFWG